MLAGVHVKLMMVYNGVTRSPPPLSPFSLSNSLFLIPPPP